jgi:hypothetical protein
VKTNREYVYVRSGFAIEGLFPDNWMVDENVRNANHFSDFQVDAAGALVKFRLKDNSKSSVGNALKARAEADADRSWASMWEVVCVALDAALEVQAAQID